MLMAIGLAAFGVGWNARIAAMLFETILIGVLTLAVLIVDIAPNPLSVAGLTVSPQVYFSLLLVAELGALGWGRRRHARAAAYDPAVAALIGDPAEAARAADHEGLQRAIVEDLEASGAAPAADDLAPPSVDLDAIGALTRRPPTEDSRPQ